MRLLRDACLLCCFLLPVLGPAFPAHADTLADSTESLRFHLANGLEVRTRSIPGAKAVAITVGYRAGSLYDPVGREGASDLLADLAFTAAAGDIPERTHAEMASLRPLGWTVRTNARMALLTEVAGTQQFPGVLRQVATRMRGVQVTDAALQTALADTRRDLGTRYFGAPDMALYYRSGDLARGMSDEALVRRASGKALEGIRAKEVSALLARLYVPGNAVLSLAGDLSGLDIRALVESEFGAIPGGSAAPEPAAPAFHSGVRAMPWPGLARPLGVLAVQSPALTDSLHPSFFLGTLVTAAGLPRTWGVPEPPLSSRFQYSIFDDAEIVRFYPPVRPGSARPQDLGEEFSFRLDELAAVTVTADQLDRVRLSIAWMLGAPLTPDIKQRTQAETGPLATIAMNTATRALWMGDAFWDDYLARFLSQRYGHNTFYHWMDQPDHQFQLLLTEPR